MKKIKPLMPGLASLPTVPQAADASAIKALSNGTANEDQQKRALAWILEEACALPIWPYRESQRETDIALGRHFVGQQIVGLLKINVSELTKREQNG